MFNIKFSNDSIRTADLWCQKQPVYQLSHNYCPNDSVITFLKWAIPGLVLFIFVFSWQLIENK